MARQNAVDTLLELLEHVPDASALEHMLEAEHLRTLMNGCGHDDDAIRAALAKKTPPGELLLGLFEAGHTSDELLAMLPPVPESPPEPAEKSRTKTAKNRETAAEFKLEDMPTSNKVGGIVVLVAIILPAMITSGMLPEWNVGSRWIWAGIAGGGAGLGGLLFARGRAPAWAGLIGGIVAGLGGLFAMQWWTSGRTSIFTIEIGLAVILGALPGAFFYTWAARRG